MTPKGAASALLLALLAAGCGYSFGSGLAQQGVHKVALRVVSNQSWRQRLEADLSAALARELYVSTDLVPASFATADAILEVDLADDRERTLVAGNRNDPVREGAEEAVVSMRLVSARSGKVLLQRTLLDRAEYRSPIGEDLTSARGELVADLARKIALALEAGF